MMMMMINNLNEAHLYANNEEEFWSTSFRIFLDESISLHEKNDSSIIEHTYVNVCNI